MKGACLGLSCSVCRGEGSLAALHLLCAGGTPALWGIQVSSTAGPGFAQLHSSGSSTA